MSAILATIGGTGIDSVDTGDMMVGGATPNTWVILAHPGAANRVLGSTGADTIGWVTALTLTALTVNGDVIHGGTGDTISRIRTSNGTGVAYLSFENSADASDSWTVGRGSDGVFRVTRSTGYPWPTGTATTILDITSAGMVTTYAGLTINGTGITFAQSAGLIQNTPDGSDDHYTYISGGGPISSTRGAYVAVYGNEVVTYGGLVDIVAGNVATGHIMFTTANTERLRIAYDGTATFSGSLWTFTKKVELGKDGGHGELLRVDGDSTGPYLEVTGTVPLRFYTGGSERLRIATGGAVTITSLAGTGSRNVVADSNGVLSAP